MALNFISPGAAAGNAIREQMLLRLKLERQAELDAQAKAEQEAAIRQRDEQLAFQREQEARIAKTQQAQMDDLANQREFTRASTIAENAMPNDPADADTQAMLQRQGFGGMLRQIPGVLMQGPIESGDESMRAEEVGQTPDQTVMRGGSKFLNAEAQRQAAAELAAQAEAGRNERAAAENQLRQIVATLAASGKAESQALANQLKELQIKLTGEKVDEAAQKRKDASSATAGTRQQIRDLAAGLMNDPELAGITGAIEGRRDTFFTPGATDAVSRFNQLVSSLALGERSKLKGQGQISDYEAKILQKAVTSLNRASGTDITKARLKEILDAFQGDTPQAGPSAPSSPGTGFRVVGVR